jgi:amino acid adenylation domain-containing protein
MYFKIKTSGDFNSEPPMTDEKEKEYWLNRLAGELEPVGFQTDSLPGLEGRIPTKFVFELPGELAAKLIKLSNNSELRLYIALMAGIVALLYKYTGREDILTGAPIFKQAVDGQLINTVLTLRESIAADITFRQLLMQVSKTLYEANENQNYPIETLLYKLNIPYSKEADFPLFDVAVLLENLHERKYLDRIHLKIIFSFVWEKQEQCIRGKVEYDARLYHENSIKWVIRHFMALLEMVFLHMDLELSRLDIVPEEEKQQLLYEFNDTTVVFPGDKTIHGLFSEQVERTPDRVGLVENVGQVGQVGQVRTINLTYRQLNEQSDRVAWLLIEKGVLADSIVGIMIERSIEVIVGMLGILKAGGAYLPIDVGYPQERIRYMLEDGNVRIILGTEKSQKEIIVNCQLLIVNCKPESLPKAPSHHSSVTVNHSSDLSYIIYTSGTTGRPKGVMIEHRNAVNTICWFAWQYGVGPGVHVLQTTEYTFDPSVEQIFGTLLHGACVFVIAKVTIGDLYLLRQFIDVHQVQVINFVPMLLKELLGAGALLKSLRVVISGGDRLEEETKNILIQKGYCLYNHYGPTEITVDALSVRCTKDDPVTLGKPIANARCEIVDSAFQLVPIGVVGELLVGGAGVARGYLNNPELTAERFNRSNRTNRTYIIYKTGDLARWLPNGHIEFQGRIDHQVKIRGFRIELEEIESQLRKYPKVRDVVVTATGDKNKYLCAYIVLDRSTGDSTFSAEEMREYLSLKFPPFMVPAYFIGIGNIPLSPNGKIDRGALPLPDIGHGEDNYIAPRDEVEEKLAVIWAEVLELDKSIVGIDMNFFDSGGHSLNATVLVAKMHKELKVKVPMVELFRAPTIRELSRYIKNAVREQYSALECVEKKEYYILSSAQERLYILQSLDDTGIGYNIPAVLELSGGIDEEKLEKVFNRLIGRHESFRTSFIVINGEPVQRIHDRVEFKIELLEGREHGAFDSFIRPFDLTHAPLLRMRLVKTGVASYLMMLDMHHIIADGVSMGILVREFSILYGSGNEQALPELRFQYKDYPEWQRRVQPRGMGTDSKNAQVVYWRKQFEGDIPVLTLPTDFNRPVIQSFEGHAIRFELDKEHSSALFELAKQEGATLFMVLLALYHILLSKLSGQEDVVVGTPTAGRSHADIQYIIGMFVNTLALRDFPVGAKPFNIFLNEVKERTLAAFENQEYQFENLLEELNITRDSGRNPLFDTMFSFENMNIPGMEIPGLKLVPMEIDSIKEVSKFDITLIAQEVGENLYFIFEYSTTLFKKETIERFIVYFKEIIAAVLKDPGAKIGDMDMIPEEEKRRLIYEFNETAAAYPVDKTIHGLFAEQVTKTPDNIVIVETLRATSLQITYRQLNEQSDRLAGLLIEKGVVANSIVGIMMERSVELIIAILGILKAGGAYLPINPEYPRERIQYMLADSNAKILINKSEARSTKFETNPNVPNSKNQNQNNGSPFVLNFENLNFEFVSSFGFRISNFKSTNLAYIIYTSGSTGMPKAVPITHANLSPLLQWGYYHLGIGVNDRTIQNLSYYFDWSVWEIFITLTTGASLYIVSEEILPVAIAGGDFINRHGISILHATPTQCQFIFNTSTVLTALKYLFIGAEKLTYDLVEQSFAAVGSDCRVFNMYGPTEATIISAVLEITRENLPRFSALASIPIGTASGNTTLLILDKYGNACPINIAGELCIGGDGVASGYLNNPELSAERFNRSNRTNRTNIFYMTGDLARRLQDGNFEFLGRIDQQVKIRGFRIELGEIEKQLLKHENIKEAVVIDRLDNTGEKYLCAYFVQRSPDPLELREYLLLTIPEYMIPVFFIRLDKIPLTPNGKVDKKALPEPGAWPEGEYVAPATDKEQEIAEAWQQVLGLEKISVNDNFFETGGNSLKIIKLSIELKKRLGIEIPTAKMFQYPTIASQARYIAQAHEKEKEVIVKFETDKIKTRLKQRRDKTKSMT